MLKMFAASAALLLLLSSSVVNSQGFGGSGGTSSNKPPSGGFGGSGGSFGGSGSNQGGGSFGGSGGSFGGSGSNSGNGGFGGSGGSSGSGNKPYSLQMCKRLVPGPEAVFPKRDIPCNGAQNCRVCGGVEKVRDACAARPNCVAFTYQPSNNCGFLKWGAGEAEFKQRGYVSYASGSFFPEAGISAAAILNMCVTLNPLLDKQVLGNDLKCKGAQNCQVCGPVELVRDYCVNAPNCVGFSYDTRNKCGYLKKDTIGNLQYQAGWVTYTR